MKTSMFKSLSLVERRARLVAILAQKTEGRLTSEELATVANYQWVDGYRTGWDNSQFKEISRFNLADCQCKIKVYSDTKEFAIAASLVREGTSNINGSYGRDDDGRWVLGGGTLGAITKLHESSSNWPHYIDRANEPNFETEATQIVVVKVHYRDDDGPDDEYLLHIYLPDSGSYKIDPVLAEILKLMPELEEMV
jgi:hypothetical protein